jgi:hypothetical protein
VAQRLHLLDLFAKYVNRTPHDIVASRRKPQLPGGRRHREQSSGPQVNFRNAAGAPIKCQRVLLRTDLLQREHKRMQRTSHRRLRPNIQERRRLSEVKLCEEICTGPRVDPVQRWVTRRVWRRGSDSNEGAEKNREHENELRPFFRRSLDDARDDKRAPCRNTYACLNMCIPCFASARWCRRSVRFSKTFR